MEEKNLKYYPVQIVGETNGGDWKFGTPLPVEGCLIMLCKQGCLCISVNSRRFTMTEGSMALIVFDMLAVPLSVSDDFRAKYIALDFDTVQNLFFLVTSNRFWDYVYRYPVFKLQSDLRDASFRWFTLLEWITANTSDVTAEKVLRNEMENFMLVVAEKVESSLGILGVNPIKNRAWVIVNEFLSLLNRYYTQQHDVAFYAEKLNITPNYLNIITKRNLGVTAKEQISMQIGIVVKMLLDTTDLTVKEIAARLHYDDASYLCRVFRKQVGMTPIQYRNKQRSDR